MQSEFDYFIAILSESGKKHGFDKTLTISHLLNIANLARKLHNQEEIRRDNLLMEAEDECFQDMYRYGGRD